jgi:hypothetical protein
MTTRENGDHREFKRALSQLSYSIRELSGMLQIAHGCVTAARRCDQAATSNSDNPNRFRWRTTFIIINVSPVYSIVTCNMSFGTISIPHEHCRYSNSSLIVINDTSSVSPSGFEAVSQVSRQKNVSAFHASVGVASLVLRDDRAAPPYPKEG